MQNGELYPFVVVWGFISFLIILLGSPIWLYREISALHRSIKCLREDIEMQEKEINQLKEKLTASSTPIASTGAQSNHVGE